MIVIDDIDRIGPSLSSYERALVVQRARVRFFIPELGASS